MNVVNIDTLNLIELKSLAFDVMKSLQKTEKDLKVIEQEIEKRIIKLEEEKNKDGNTK